jgi:general secretion pathway protein A
MYLDFYHLREQPFGVTPNPAYLYPSQTHREALDSLSAGLQADRGFMALIAQPGMGKTTLLYQLLDVWRDSARTVLLFQTQCDSREFFRYVLAELGFEAEQMGLVEMHHKLNRIFFGEMLGCKRFILAVDEAQNLTEPVLETIRLLSNFETEHTKLLQIVLAGQPQLAEKLAQPRLAQLRQRVAVLSHLEPLTPREVPGYIEHRLKVAGYSGEPLFAPDALELISQRSQGIPRNINNICHNSLSMACASQRHNVTSEIVQKVVIGLDVESVAQQSSGRRRPVAAPVRQSRAVDRARRAPTQHLTYQPRVRFCWSRRIFSAIALIGILSLGGRRLFGSFHKWGRPGQAKTELTVYADSPNSPISLGLASVSGIKPSTYAADPQDTGAGQILTVVTRPGQTLEEICLLYVGHFDVQLWDWIRALNPDLTEVDHLEAGQLIRLPLPAGTLRSGMSIPAIGTAVQKENPQY